jgi:hypothetical protein
LQKSKLGGGSATVQVPRRWSFFRPKYTRQKVSTCSDFLLYGGSSWTCGTKVLSTTLTGNAFSAKLTKPRGIYLEGVANAPESGFIVSLRVNGNLFGCGFRAPVAFPPFPSFPPNAFVRPRLQAHTGNIGLLIPCQ